MYLSASLNRKPRPSFEVIRAIFDSQVGHVFDVLCYSKAPNGEGEGFGYHMAVSHNGGPAEVFYSWIAKLGPRWVLSITNEIEPNWPITGSAKILRLTSSSEQAARIEPWRQLCDRLIQGKKGCERLIVGRTLILKYPIIVEGFEGDARVDALMPMGNSNYQIIAGSAHVGGYITLSEPKVFLHHPTDTIDVELTAKAIEEDAGYTKIGCAYIRSEPDANVIVGRAFTKAERAERINKSVANFAFHAFYEERPFFA